jgi:superfamily II DNA or RNA helicase
LGAALEAVKAVADVAEEIEVINLDLPQLNYGPVKCGAGSVQCVLRPPERLQALVDGAVLISTKIKESVYLLPNGERVIVTERKNVVRPDGIHGLLIRNADDSLTWKSHTIIDLLEADAANRGWPAVVSERASGWANVFKFKAEIPDKNGIVASGKEGLRPPQIGALHSIGAHWSLSQHPATVVMPTGTGKTETMLSALAAYDCRSILVIVPTDALRSQTARKFLTFGLLRKLGALEPMALNPIVGVVTKRPKSIDDLDIFERCNVVISTMAALKPGKADSEDEADEGEEPDDREDTVGEEVPLEIAHEIARRVRILIVDEAHHIPASGWNSFREAFRGKPVLQFTATPFRRDGRLVDGQVIYSYPLRKAQEDKYFKPITFSPVYEPVLSKADGAIAEIAVGQLRADIKNGLNHLMMARCKNIARAKAVHAIYEKLAPDLKPLLLHSKTPDGPKLIDELRAGKSRIVVCVNMLGEGFDLPELKVAAIHDLHKSLAILLQFTGRFTRSAADKIGDATVVANIAEPNVTGALERLYSEDADWNQLLSELSSEAAKDHARLIAFLNDAKPLVGEEDDSDTAISRRLLRPTLSTLVYEAKHFRPKNFHDGLPGELMPYRAWLHGDDTLFFVTKSEPYLKWCRSKAVRDTEWALFVLHFDKKRELLYLSSSDHSSEFQSLAKAVGAGDLINGEIIFRSLGRITRLLFQNIGLKKHGRRNLSYAMYTGAQVEEALGLSEKGGSTKSNLSGIGWEDGHQVSIGCSAKGRIWSRDKGTIPEFNDWSESVGDKLRDNGIDLKDLLANVLIPTEVEALPDAELLSMELPLEMLRESEERIVFAQVGHETNSVTCDINVIGVDRNSNAIDFELVQANVGQWGTFRFSLGGINKFDVKQTTGAKIHVTVGRLSKPLEDYFSERPPLFRFVDLTELDANLHIKPQNPQDLILPEDRFEPWDWKGVDFKKESMWKDGVLRPDSIQAHAAQFFTTSKFDVVFDDDASGEAADLVCLKLEDDRVRVVLVHCKFAGGATAGERVKDVVEVCSQAVRSTKWNGKFSQLCAHLKKREEALKVGGRTTRFLVGSTAVISQLLKASRIKPSITEILIVQPGLSKAGFTKDQSQVLAASFTYLKETINVDMAIVCSA